MSIILDSDPIPKCILADSNVRILGKPYQRFPDIIIPIFTHFTDLNRPSKNIYIIYHISTLSSTYLSDYFPDYVEQHPPVTPLCSSWCYYPH